MRIILSRKGFDSAAGGCPSPIFPDGRLFSLPIPDKKSPIVYSDIQFEGMNVGELVSQLTRDPKRIRHFAHLDPDLRSEAINRLPGWRPLMGQAGSAQGHLRNEGIQLGGIFSSSLDLFDRLSKRGAGGVSSEMRRLVMLFGAGFRLEKSARWMIFLRTPCFGRVTTHTLPTGQTKPIRCTLPQTT